MLDREQVRRWFSRREREGLTYRELSARVGVPANTLCHWAWRLRREARSGAVEKPAFVELTVASRPEIAVGQRVEIVLRSKRRVIVDAALDSAALTRLVAALERC